MQPGGRSESTTWLDSSENLSGPRRWLKVSGIHIFSVLQMRAGLLILIWMASLVIVATCYIIYVIVLVYYLVVGGCG